MIFIQIYVGQPGFMQERSGQRRVCPGEALGRIRLRGGSGNTGKLTGNTGLLLTLAGKPVRRRTGKNSAIRWRRRGGWGRG
jgi:hypothetical protein